VGEQRRDLNQFALARWLSIFPGLAIVITVLSINLFGDDLCDALARLPDLARHVAAADQIVSAARALDAPCRARRRSDSRRDCSSLRRNSAMVS